MNNFQNCDIYVIVTNLKILFLIILTLSQQKTREHPIHKTSDIWQDPVQKILITFHRNNRKDWSKDTQLSVHQLSPSVVSGENLRLCFVIELILER
jgi:hypothetical protein